MISTLTAFVLAAATVVFDVETGKPSHYTTDVRKSPPVFSISNTAATAVGLVGSVTASNYFGEAVTLPVSANAAAGGVVRVPMDFSRIVRSRGIWRATAVVTADGLTTTGTTSFAVLPENKVTPRIPRGTFRIGLQYHMSWFKDEEQPARLDALTATGCKLVRVGGFHAHVCWPDEKKGVDFSRADRLMAMLKERGLSANVFCWPNAKWMAEEADQKRPYPAYIRSRTKKGVMGLFAEKLAAHFGTDIDYIEPSNEPDFWDKDAMSIDDYLSYQREVYEGVKRGCPDIQVLTPGWAQPDSSHPRIVLKGLQERVLTDGKGTYDVHAIHGHGWQPVYEKSMTETFFPLRKKLNVTAPWFSNETGATCVNGAEDAVAKTVWQKVLWSAAHGSVDYIWYNLIATGTDPADPEQGFGLLTRDLHPRSAFASFAALTHLLSGLAFDGIVHEGKGRYLYRWKGLVRGKSRVVLVGWDDYADEPAEVKVRTDAAAVATYDLMGNTGRLDGGNGVVTMRIGCLPSALVFGGSTSVSPDAADLARTSVPKQMNRRVKAKIKWRPPDLQLMAWWQVHEIYAANAETTDRTWKGVEDLSANIYVGYEGGCLRVYFEVKDDREAPHDGIWFSLEPTDQRRKYEFRASFKEKAEVNPQTGRICYDMRVPLKDVGFTEETLRRGFIFQAKVYDDDGIGDDFDFWMETKRCWTSVEGIEEEKK